MATSSAVVVRLRNRGAGGGCASATLLTADVTPAMLEGSSRGKLTARAGRTALGSRILITIWWSCATSFAKAARGVRK